MAARILRHVATAISPSIKRSVFKCSRSCSSQTTSSASLNIAGLQGVSHKLDNSAQQLSQEGAQRLIDAAARGDARAQLFLGQCFYDGNGFLKRNLREAMHWLKLAAEQGDAEAQYFCGRALDENRGVPRDTRAAVSWYKKAAKQGHAGAQANLGVALFAGEGIKQSMQKAFKWFKKAAKQGESNAQFRLGCFCADGCDDVAEVDFKQAAHWFRLAAEQDHPMAQLRLGVQLLNGDGVDENRDEALSWLRKAAPHLPEGVHPEVDEMKASLRAQEPSNSE